MTLDRGPRLPYPRGVLTQESADPSAEGVEGQTVAFAKKAWDILVDKLTEMGTALVQSLPNLLIGVVLVLLTALVAKITRSTLQRALKKRALRPSLKDLFLNVGNIVVWLVGMLVAATAVIPSLDFGGVIATLGLSSVAIGFAFKDVFENFLAGILILLRDPMEIGDFIECEGNEGRIEGITIRDTIIRQSDGQAVILPNAFLFKNPVRIITHAKSRRASIVCGVAYGEDVDQAREVIREAVRGVPSLTEGRPIEIYAMEFGASSVDFEVSWWCGSKPSQERASRDEVVAAIKRALDDAGIEIPFPYRTLTFKEPLTVAQKSPES